MNCSLSTRLRVLAAMGLAVLVWLLPSSARDNRAIRDIEYAQVDGISLRLDLYLPSAMGTGLVPLVVWIHGGAWMSGSKANCPALDVLGDVYAVASIDYRLSQVAPFPAQIYDCKAAIRFLRAHAHEYGVDADRIGVWGASAGGHLAALLGTSGGIEELEGDVGDDLGTSSAVSAVCDFCGPTDLGEMVRQLLEMDPLAPVFPIVRLLGGPLEEEAALALLASPITHVDAGDPPFLIVHGNQDEIVPYMQAVAFHRTLADAEVDATLHMVGRAGHCAFPDVVNDIVRTFFDRALKAGWTERGASDAPGTSGVDAPQGAA